MALSPPKKVSEIKTYIRALVYSDPGVGKTTLAATAQSHPAMRDCLVLNFEGGTLSIAGVEGVEVVDIRSMLELEEVFWALVKREPGYDHFNTVIIDSGSEMQTLDLELIAREGYVKEHREKKDKASRESVDQLFQADYGESTAKLKRLFRWFRDAPFNLIITALVRRGYKKKGRDQEPEIIYVGPAFTDKLGQAVMGYCDFVWYLYNEDVLDKDGRPTGEVKRKLLTQTHMEFRAKTRGQKFSKAIGKVVTGPDIAALYQQLLETEGVK